MHFAPQKERVGTLEHDESTSSMMQIPALPPAGPKPGNSEGWLVLLLHCVS